MISIIPSATVLNFDLYVLLKVDSLGIGGGWNKAGLTGRLQKGCITGHSVTEAKLRCGDSTSSMDHSRSAGLAGLKIRNEEIR